MSVVVIGQNSFIARHLKDRVMNMKSEDWIFLSHKEALQTDEWLDQAGVTINCAFSPKLFQEPYQAEEDIDNQLADKIKDRPHIHTIMMSSRTVYGDTENLHEESIPNPTHYYGQAKWTIEQKLTDKLDPSRLSILRCSNIFGFEYGRSTFLGHALTALKEQNKIIFNMSPETQKDFMPVENFCDRLIQIVDKNPSGVYNVGSGISIPCAEIAQGLIEGYGTGSLESLDPTMIKGQFFMDIEKLNHVLGKMDISPDLIKQKCIQLGQMLKNI